MSEENQQKSGNEKFIPESRAKIWLRYGLTGFFVLAGINHFISPEWYLDNQMPPWIPFPLITLYMTGIAEIAGGIGLLVPRLRIWAGWGLGLLLVAIFPGNIHMASEAMHTSGWSGETFGLFLRLPLQAVFIVAVLWVSRGAPHQPAPSE